MLPRQQQPPRRHGHVSPPYLCAVAAFLLLVLSLSVLHFRLSSSPSSPLPPPSLSLSDHLLRDLDNPTTATVDGVSSTSDPIDSLDLLDETSSLEFADADADESSHSTPSTSALVFDHAASVFRLPFGSSARSSGLHDSDFASESESEASAFGSDDQPVDEGVRKMLAAMSTAEDALLLTGKAELKDGWSKWLEGKGDFLRRNRMLKSNLELLHPRNHPLLQDPDVLGLSALTRGDRFVQRVLLSEWDMINSSEGEDMKHGEKLEVKNAEFNKEKEKTKVAEKKLEPEKEKELVGRRWGYFPGIDAHLGFSEFMDRFLDGHDCSLRVFMVWNSPQWMYGVRHQRSLESLLRQNKDACVVMLSETLELTIFQEFVNEGFKVAVALPNLDELLRGTPTEVFSSLWFEWRKTKHYPVHYSELIRLAALYKYGGLYLDSDMIVLKPLSALSESIGIESEDGSSISGAVMAFKKNSPYLMECLKEFHATYDDTLLRWNGAELMTRVMRNLSNLAHKRNEQLDVKIEPSFKFYPVSSSNITRYFAEPNNNQEISEQEALLAKIADQSITFHLWNGITSSLVPEPNSLVYRLLSQHFLRCLDAL